MHAIFVFLHLGYLVLDYFFSSSIYMPANFIILFFKQLINTPLGKWATFSLSIHLLSDI